MTLGTWQIDMTSPLVLVGTVLLLLSLASTLRMVWRRRTSPHRFWIAAVLNLIAYGTILLLLLAPESPKEARQTVTLITDTLGMGSTIEAPAYLAPGVATSEATKGTLPLYAIGQLSLKEPGLGTLDVRGHGLDEADWRALSKGIRVTWAPPALEGLYDIRWPKNTPVGEDWQITGIYGAPATAGDSSIFTVELMDPAGNKVASQPIKSGQRFSLGARTKTSGPLLYRLKVTDRKGAELSSGLIPVSSERPQPVKLMVVQSAPSFEARHMLEWAARFGADLTVQTRISKDRYITQSSLKDAPQQPLPFAPDTLAAQDMLVIDGRSLADLTATNRAALEQAVQAGLGVLVIADSSLINNITGMPGSLLAGFTLKETDATQHSAAPRWPGQVSEMPLPVLPYELVSVGGTPLVISDHDTVLNLMQRKGMGRIALSLLRQRHAWATSGDTALYAAYWSYIMGELSRPATAPRLLPPASDRLTRITDKTILCALTTEANMTLEVRRLNASKAVEGRVSLVPDRAGSPRSCAAFYPQANGWYQLALHGPKGEADIQDEAFLYVHGATEWPSVDAHDRQAATRLHIALDGPEAFRERALQMDKVIPPLWLWLVLIVSATLLWIERKLD